jgi:hypothetical protein
MVLIRRQRQYNDFEEPPVAAQVAAEARLYDDALVPRREEVAS